MTDWWREENDPQDAPLAQAPGWTAEEPVTAEPQQELPVDPVEVPRSRKKGAVIAAVAVVAVAGGFWLTSSDGEPRPTAEAPAVQPGELFPAAGGGPTEAASVDAERGVPSAVAVEGVALRKGDGKAGRTGVLVELTVTNRTNRPLILSANLFVGDGRTGMVGEGTLAPGSRTVPPGGEAKGTVEFAGLKSVTQIVLSDFQGLILATAG